ncbi:MAG: DUF2130 domain-containing protein [Alphaproteobacteria bacterium]|nr:DUF2130 domain-containing protein [Alphaproteobacteria bacterium]
MTEPTITCPACKTEIKLTESLAAPLLESTRLQYEQKISQKEVEVSKREEEIRVRQETLVKAQNSLHEQVEIKLKEEREKIIAEEARKARFALSLELEQKATALSELQEVLKERDIKLGEAQKAQAELIRKQRELDDAKREMDLTIEKKVQDSLTLVREQTTKEVSEVHKLKILESQTQMAAMQRQIEELKQRAEQGSQQLQGEVQELELEDNLRSSFPQDIIQPVPKGEFGGDVIHQVFGSLGQMCGTILWESKRTKNWSDAWLVKLRDDQRSAKAEIALIISQVLPKEFESFGLVDGVWIAKPKYAIPLAMTLRHSLIELASARQAGEGQQTKTELVYQYLTGPRFRHRVEAIVEKFSDMQDDLDRERKTMTRLWAKREEQIRGVIDATAGMYGDLQGIAGKTLQEIEGLNIPMIEDNRKEDSTKEN